VSRIKLSVSSMIVLFTIRIFDKIKLGKED
jgi:hypothetical protein